MRKSVDKDSWSMRTAARLRSVHASFGEESESRRGGFLEDELEFALDEGETIAGETRDSLLRSLGQWFPVYGEAPDLEERPAPKVESVASRLDVDAMIEALAARRHELSRAQLQKLAGVLGESPAPSSGAVIPPQIAELLSFPKDPAELEDCIKGIKQLWRVVGQDEDAVIRLTRMVKMLGIFTGAFRDLYGLAWSFWKEMAPKEVGALIAPGTAGGIEALVADYIGGGNVSSGDFFKEVEKTKKVIVGMLYSSHRGGLDYGKFCERRFAPDAIIDAVALEESATDVNRVRDLGRKCWDKYSQLSRNRTAEAMHEEFLRIFAENVHIYIKKNA
jgi:hypothetical protein